MAGGEGPLLHQSEQILRKSQQTQGIGNGRAGFSHPLRYLLLGEAVFLHQSLEAPGLLGGVQVLPLEVLDQTQLHDLSVIRLNDDSGDLIQTGLLGGPPAALPGDDLVVAGGQTADGEGLDDAVEADRVGQIGEGLRLKALAGLVQAWPHLGDGEGDGALASGGQVRVAQQGVEPPAQTHLCFSFRHSTLLFQTCGVRRGRGERRLRPSGLIHAARRSPRPASDRPRPRGSRGRSPARAFRGWALRTDGRCGESPWRRPGRGSGA